MNPSDATRPEEDRYPRRHSRTLRLLGRGVLRLFGWRISGALPELSRFVVIIAPHTSNWDFILGLAGAFAIDVKAHWIGKHTIFRPPFGRFFERLGGIPVNRASTEGLVDTVALRIREADSFVVGIAPEGTRKSVDRWRSGFYYIAMGSGVPVVPCAFDYASRRFLILAPFYPSGDYDSDLQQLRGMYEGFGGKDRVFP